MLVRVLVSGLLFASPAWAAPPRPVRQVTITLCGAPLVHGALDKALIRQVIKAHRNELRACYQLGLLQRSTLTGRVTLWFQVAPSGQVQAVRVNGPQSFEPPAQRAPTDRACHAELEGPAGPLSATAEVPSGVLPCLATAVSNWRFPSYLDRRDTITEVTYPIVFRTWEEPAQPVPVANTFFSEEELANMSSPDCHKLAQEQN